MPRTSEIVAELTEPVRASLDGAVALVEDLLSDLTTDPKGKEGIAVMSDITISRPAQVGLLLAILGCDRSGRRQAAPRDPAVPQDPVDVAMHRVRVRVVEDALDANNTIARANREDFDRAGVTVVNLMSAPGAGKTALLERVLADTGDIRVAVLEGDVEGSLDAERLASLHIPVVQLNTSAGFGGECHLDANMVRSALHSLPAGGDRPADRSRTSATSSARPSSASVRTCARWSARSPRARTSR